MQLDAVLLVNDPDRCVNPHGDGFILPETTSFLILHRRKFRGTVDWPRREMMTMRCSDFIWFRVLVKMCRKNVDCAIEVSVT